ncbi:TPA: hypothetical protein ACVU4T_003346 [Vibrio parahaemolyticus]
MKKDMTAGSLSEQADALLVAARSAPRHTLLLWRQDVVWTNQQINRINHALTRTSLTHQEKAKLEKALFETRLIARDCRRHQWYTALVYLIAAALLLTFLI